MDELDWLEDAAELERDRATLRNLEMVLAPGKTVTYEASAQVDLMTRKLLERSWQEFDGAPDRNRVMVDELLKRAQTLRRSASMVPGDRYEQEYQSWLQSWKKD